MSSVDDMAARNGETQATPAFTTDAASTAPVHTFVGATKHSLDGVAFALKSERAFRQEAVALLIAVPLACALTPNLLHRALLIGALLFVMAVELLNTCAEKL